MKIDISKGRYWDEGITLVESCTPCSPGCDHCWALAMERRFKPEFKNQIKTHPERLKRFNTRKPKVFSIWNDLYHVSVPDSFQCEAYKKMILNKQNTYLILTKRPAVMAKFLSPETCFSKPDFPHIWHGLTVCNQQEADGKHEFLAIPGNLFLSLEPLLSDIDLRAYLHCPLCGYSNQDQLIHGDHHLCKGGKIPEVRCVILGGETGPGSRPMRPDWVRSVRDQCAAAGVPFFFKQWGAWIPKDQFPNYENGLIESFKTTSHKFQDGKESWFCGNKKSRIIDRRFHDELPWVK